MDLSALLGGMRGAQGAGPGRKVKLAAFRCGKVQTERIENGTKLRCVPERTRGLLQVVKDMSEQTIKVVFTNRATNATENEWTVFPDDITLRKCRIAAPGAEGGEEMRIYELRFTHANNRVLFWSQEPKVEKDKELTKKIVEAVNNPAAAEAALRAGDNPSAAAAAAAAEEDPIAALVRSLGGGRAGAASAQRGMPAPSAAANAALSATSLEQTLASLLASPGVMDPGARPSNLNLNAAFANAAATPGGVTAAATGPASSVASSSAAPATDATTTDASTTASSTAGGSGGVASTPAPAPAPAASSSSAAMVDAGDEDMDEELRQALALSMADTAPPSSQNNNNSGSGANQGENKEPEGQQ